MGFLRPPASWLLGLADHFPAAVQPGICIAIVVLIIWLFRRAGRPAFNLAVRVLCVLTDLIVGLLLLPEYLWTRAQRSRGVAPGEIILAGSRAAEAVLDGVAVLYQAHPLLLLKKRPPLITIVFFLVLSGVDFWLLHKSPPNGATKVALDTWKYWVKFKLWSLND